jgi:hypothetical protein
MVLPVLADDADGTGGGWNWMCLLTMVWCFDTPPSLLANHVARSMVARCVCMRACACACACACARVSAYVWVWVRTMCSFLQGVARKLVDYYKLYVPERSITTAFSTEARIRNLVEAFPRTKQLQLCSYVVCSMFTVLADVAAWSWCWCWCWCWCWLAVALTLTLTLI